MSVTQQVDDWPAPPVPVDGCNDCWHLNQQRIYAKQDRDPSRVTDAQVLLRQHLKAEHEGHADADAS